jgi:glutaminase
VYFIASGHVQTLMPGPDGHRVKLNRLGAGMTFGEMALGEDKRQETTVKADGAVEVWRLPAEEIAELEENEPRLAMQFWRALTQDAYTRVEQYLRETAVRVQD